MQIFKQSNNYSSNIYLHIYQVRPKGPIINKDTLQFSEKDTEGAESISYSTRTVFQPQVLSGTKDS